tara:strand:- start:8438 stop:8707 length:270 start_codon:yes stop_codon:yes gene_type:complete
MEETQEILMTKDGTYKTLESIKDMLPYGDDTMWYAVYKHMNEGLLKDEEVEKIDLEIKRLQEAYKAKLDKSIQEQDRIAEERLKDNNNI